jgi:hypothetical protein
VLDEAAAMTVADDKEATVKRAMEERVVEGAA